MALYGIFAGPSVKRAASLSAPPLGARCERAGWRERTCVAMAAMLEGFVDKVVQIVTNDGRNIVGLLKGFDQTTNVVLDECHERVFSSTAGVEQVVLGLYIVRGDNM